MESKRPESLPVRRSGSAAPTKAARRAVQHQRETAAVEVARVNRVALTARVAMQRAAELSEMEARLIKLAPVGEARYQAIADAAAIAMAGTVQQQSLDS
jgi:type II secretory pathway component HofQ